MLAEVGVAVAVALAAVFIVYFRGKEKTSSAELCVMMVLGSGGHTAEMLQLAAVIDREKFSTRVYVVADTDVLSADKAKAADPTAVVTRIPRAREVHQAWLSTVWSTAVASVAALRLIATQRPDVLLCNGPGTCVPLCCAAYLMNVICKPKTKIVFVESFCRVKTLSMSAKLVTYLTDNVLVQWPELAQKYPRTKYITRFV